jgi:hypothetical protein
MVDTLARGGKRTGAGRVPLFLTSECGWMVDNVRRILTDTSHTRNRRWIARHRPREIGAHQELDECYDALSALPSVELAAMIEQPISTPIEDIRDILDNRTITPISPIPHPNQFELAQAYEQTAVLASMHFGKRITKRQVQRCVKSWQRLEAILKRKTD